MPPRRSCWIWSLSCIWVAALTTLALADLPPEPGEMGRVTIVDDPQCVVASELMGTWVVDNALTLRVSGWEQKKVSELVFRESEEARKRMQLYLENFLESIEEDRDYPAIARALTSVYLVGEMEVTGEGESYVFDFMVVAWRGNTAVLLYDRGNDIERVNVAIARNLDGDNDLLIIGGDQNNQSFEVFKRKGVE